MAGWIKLHRQLTDWEWYDDINTTRIFLHILLTANHEPKKWQGNVVEAGQKITSVSHLASETGLSARNVRTALDHLKRTGEITIESTNRFTLITVAKWGKYQGVDCETDKQTDKRPTSNRQTTDKQPTTNKNDKNDKNDKNNIYAQVPSELVDTLKAFEEHRKKLKSPLTDHSLGLLVKKANKLADGDTSVIMAIFNQSMERGWKGVFPLDETKNKPRNEVLEMIEEGLFDE